MSRWRDPGFHRVHRDEGAAIPAHDRAVDLAVQCLGPAEGAGDPAPAGGAADRDGRLPRESPARSSEGATADLSGPPGPSAGRSYQAADERRLDDDRARGER